MRSCSNSAAQRLLHHCLALRNVSSSASVNETFAGESSKDRVNSSYCNSAYFAVACLCVKATFLAPKCNIRLVSWGKDEPLPGY
jgi:hypothetical protein